MRVRTWALMESRPPALPGHDRRGARDYNESELAREVHGFAEGPSKRSEVPPQLDPAIFMAMFGNLQGNMTTLAALLESHTANTNPLIASLPARSS